MVPGPVPAFVDVWRIISISEKKAPRDDEYAQDAHLQFCCVVGPKVNDSFQAHEPHTSGITSSAQPITDDIFEALDRFSALVRSTNAPEGVIQTFCQQMVATIPTVDMAGVALVPERGTTPQTVACTDARVLEIELDQHRVYEKPCVEPGSRRRQSVSVKKVAAKAVVVFLDAL